MRGGTGSKLTWEGQRPQRASAMPRALAPSLGVVVRERDEVGEVERRCDLPVCLQRVRRALVLLLLGLLFVAGLVLVASRLGVACGPARGGGERQLSARPLRAQVQLTRAMAAGRLSAPVAQAHLPPLPPLPPCLPPLPFSLSCTPPEPSPPSSAFLAALRSAAFFWSAAFFSSNAARVFAASASMRAASSSSAAFFCPAASSGGEPFPEPLPEPLPEPAP